MTLPLECDLNVEVSKLAERSSAGYPKSEQPVSRWYAAYTCPRHEKYVARQLDERCIDTFLPLYRSLRRWKDRRTQIELPLFPGYVYEIETLRKGLDLQIYAEPHPYLHVGRRVRVLHEPMAGTEGILVRKKINFA